MKHFLIDDSIENLFDRFHEERAKAGELARALNFAWSQYRTEYPMIEGKEDFENFITQMHAYKYGY